MKTKIFGGKKLKNRPLSKKDYANFWVSFKLLLKKEGQFLILTQTKANLIDLPGGRVENGEEKLPIKNVLDREIKEELGKNVKYEVLRPIFQYRRHDKTRGTHVLITVYEGDYLSGNIKLSSEHNKYEWINPKKQSLKNRKFDNKEEKLALLKYFKEWK